MGIYHRIRALHEAGIEIILHTFYKQFMLANPLSAYCKVIYQYPRLSIWKIQNLKFPFFVQSRRSEALVNVLAADDHPILFEGLHTTFHFDDSRLRGRRKYVRMHNVESDYYGHLARIEANVLKKFYYRFESSACKKLESSVLKKANRVFAISRADHDYFSHRHIASFWIPPFIDPVVRSPSGLGKFALYHGDLSIQENENAVMFLVKKVFNDLEFPLVIAGYRPSRRLIRVIQAEPKIKLYVSPAHQDMNALVSNAQMILAPFSQTTGYKMKLLESLTKSRHIITSKNMLVVEELKDVLHFVEDDPTSWKDRIQQVASKPFGPVDVELRQRLMTHTFDPHLNAAKMIEVIFDNTNDYLPKAYTAPNR